MVHKLSIAAQALGAPSCDLAGSLQPTALSSDVSIPSLATLSRPADSQSAGRWSPRRTAAFLIFTNGVAWLGLAAALKAVI